MREARADYVLTNQRTGAVVASRLEGAFDAATRKRGLLGRDGLEPGHALIIAPTNLVHTFFMRFAIDIIFVGRDGTVRKVSRAVPARRIVGALRGFAVIEMAAHSSDADQLRAGDRLQLSGSSGI